MDKILHHFDTMGNHDLLAFTGESSNLRVLGGAGFPPSTALLGCSIRQVSKWKALTKNKVSSTFGVT